MQEDVSHLLLSEGGIIRPCDLRICTSLTCLASLCTLGNGGTDFFVLPQPRHWHWNSTSAIFRKYRYNPFALIGSVTFCKLAIMLTGGGVHKRRLHMTVLFRDTMIDTIGHIFELPVTIIPATFVYYVLRGIRAHRDGRSFHLSTVLIHFDRSFFPGLLFPCR